MLKDPFEVKHQLLLNKRKNVGLIHCHDSKAFIEYSKEMDYIYENIQEYNPNVKREILTVFYNRTVDVLSNKNLQLIVTEPFVIDYLLIKVN